VLHVPTGRRFRYGELAADAALIPVPADVALSDQRSSSSSALRPNAWTHRRRSTAQPSMASTSGRRA